jgi:RNA polymerase sigma factor (TIGR02999 family)
LANCLIGWVSRRRITDVSTERMDPATDVTHLLQAWSDGDKAAAEPLMDAVYGELRRLARAYLLRERRDHSLPATGLVHEAYLRLVDQHRARWQNRAHFFAVASQVMRRLLVDHARARSASKRGSGLTVSLDDVDVGGAVQELQPDVIALDRALEKLAAIDARHARLVELRFFGGLTVDEAAAVLDVAAITVKRDWALARTWLYRELNG